jgi:Flp pilus assembly protein TadG
MTTRRKSQRGNAMVEFAIGWFVLWSLFSGVYQFGYAFYVYNVLQTSVAHAAQLGSRLTYDTASPASYTTAVKNMVVYGDETAGTKAQVPNLTTGNVNVSVNLDGAGMPRYVTVNITGYTINALFATYPLNNKPAVTTLYYGQVRCATC